MTEFEKNCYGMTEQDIREQYRNKYDTRHGGAFDRGSADSWYDRGRNPHLYEGDTAFSPRIEMSMMSPDDINAYHAGYDWNEKFGGKKDYE